MILRISLLSLSLVRSHTILHRWRINVIIINFPLHHNCWGGCSLPYGALAGHIAQVIIKTAAAKRHLLKKSCLRHFDLTPSSCYSHMLRPPETLHPPQPARLQSWTDSFHSRGHSNNVSQFLVSISAQHHHPASPAGFKRSVEGTEPQLLVDLLSKPKPHLRSGALVAQVRHQPELRQTSWNCWIFQPHLWA